MMTNGPVPDPAYGTRICRRGVRLTKVEGAVIGELEDSVHALRCRVEHDGEVVTRIEAEFIRHPTTICGGALAMLDGLIGLPLSTPLTHFYGDGKAKLHCTHAYDLVWWSIAHARRAPAGRRDHVIVAHQTEGQVTVSVHVDGAPLFDLRIADDEILSPEPFAGKNIQKGFVRWAIEHLEGDTLEAALVLHKGYFISRSHRFLQIPGPVANSSRDFEGACWTYTQPRMAIAEYVESRREFVDGIGLLEFRDARAG
jgi:hypothetical protein